MPPRYPIYEAVPDVVLVICRHAEKTEPTKTSNVALGQPTYFLPRTKNRTIRTVLASYRDYPRLNRIEVSIADRSQKMQ